jgi:hypothetical protein
MNSQDFRNLQEAYLEVVSNQLDEGAAQNVADRARKLANQRKGQTPERKKILQDLEYKADERANPKPEADWRTGISDSSRKMNVSTYADRDKVKIKTTNPKKLRKQKAMGELKDSFDLYDIILSHLIDEGYADTEDSALVIMANMSEDWRHSIVEDYKPWDFGPKQKAKRKYDQLVKDKAAGNSPSGTATRANTIASVAKDMRTTLDKNSASTGTNPAKQGLQPATQRHTAAALRGAGGGMTASKVYDVKQLNRR